MRLVLASRNAHKLRELERLLAPHELVPMPAELELAPETGSTFRANAVAKARQVARATGLPALADDSGLEAVALGGAPGVRSARFAGERATDAENLRALLAAVPAHGDRRVRYVCVLAHVTPDGHEQCVEGRCDGLLALHPRGRGGFGYDPAFLPLEEDGRTMAELSPAEKDRISHRGRAARALAPRLAEERAPAP